MFLRMKIIYIVVPILSPVNVTAVETSGRSLKVSWKEIPFEGRSGIILGYIIFFNAILIDGSLGSTKENKVDNASIFQMELVGLTFTADYNITVAGFTIIGSGLKSAMITGVTGKYSKSLSFLHLTISQYFITNLYVSLIVSLIQSLLLFAFTYRRQQKYKYFEKATFMVLNVMVVACTTIL